MKLENEPEIKPCGVKIFRSNVINLCKGLKSKYFFF